MVFPPLTTSYLLDFQFSSWYPRFSGLSIKSTIIPLDERFREYLDAEGVFDPDFPELDERIRACIEEYGAVFPKLNFSSPRDAAWLLPPSFPLKCTSPSEVYMLLKSSDFIAHDLDHASYPRELELVLRKWYPFDPSRELRCFVRRGALVGVSQRDPNYYEFWNDELTRGDVVGAVVRFWEMNVRDRWGGPDYVFDLLLTRDLSRAHVVDFNPYAPQTDPLLFTYEELNEIEGGPVFKVVETRVSCNAPVHQHNMVPLEVLGLSAGRTVIDFAMDLEEEIKRCI